MIITKVHLVLGTSTGCSKMCSFDTQHNVTDVSSLEGVVHQCSCQEVVLESLAVRPNGLTTACNRVTTPAQDLHVRLLHLLDLLRPATQTADETEEYFCL